MLLGPKSIHYFLTLISILTCISVHSKTYMAGVQQLKLACWNARGYLSSILYLKKLLSEVDVLAMSEHWLHSNRLGVLDEIVDTHAVFARSSRSSAAEFYGSRRGQGGGGLPFSGIRKSRVSQKLVTSSTIGPV